MKLKIEKSGNDNSSFEHKEEMKVIFHKSMAAYFLNNNNNNIIIIIIIRVNLA